MFARMLPPVEGSFFLFGPRGTGKSTWIAEHYRDATVYDLLRTDESIRLNANPAAFGHECDALPDGARIVIDEVQKAPMILDEVQRLIGAKKQRFVLSGSSARKLRRGGANLLAGRASVRHMFALVSREVNFQRSVDDILRFGMLPLAVTGENPLDFLKAYAETYLREEIQAEALVRQIGSFARFLEIAARMNGQMINAAGVARDAGVARQTVQDYFQILADTLLADWLPAWKDKRANRITAHPKFYLFDCGVARQLAGIGHQSLRPEERGVLLETFLLQELRAFLHYRGLDYPLFYWRTRDGVEIDIVVEGDRTLIAIEVKAATRWDRRFHSGLLKFHGLYPKRAKRLIGVYTGDRATRVDGIEVLPWKTFLKRLWGDEVIP